MNNIWIDVTYYLKWKRPPTGIIRVEDEIIKWCLKNNKNVHFFKYTLNGHFVPVDLASYFSKKRGKLNYSALFKIPALGDLKIFFYQSGRALHGLLLSFIDSSYHHRLNNFIKRNISLFKNFRNNASSKQFTRRSITHPFKEFDIILCPGMTWNYYTINNDIAFIKTQMTIYYFGFCHDIASIKFPHLCLINKYPFFEYFRKLALTADHIFCISKCTNFDFKNFLLEQQLPNVPTSIVKEGVTTIDKVIKINPRLKKILEQDFILYVSTIERRKNHECIYKAILFLLESGYENIPKIIFVGLKGWGVADLLKDLSLDPRIKNNFLVLSEVSDDDLSCLYKNALFTVYPSYYEGWGLPVAEALSYGKFGLVSTAASLPEVGEQWVEYINPYDIVGWANKIRFYLENPEQLVQKEINIRENYVSPTWDNFCNSLFEKVSLHISIS